MGAEWEWGIALPTALNACWIGRVDLGGCPPRPPTDPDVRHYRIRFLRSTDLQPIAIRRSFGEMPVGISVPCIGPSDEPVSRHPLPSTGSRRSVPPLPRYYEMLRLPTTRPPTLRFLRVVGTVSRPAFAPSGMGRARRKARSIGHPDSLTGRFTRRWQGLPGSWATPLVHMLGSSTPEDSRHQATTVPRVLPSAVLTTSAPRCGPFEAGLPSLCPRCLRFAARVTPRPRKTRFRLVANLGRAGLHTCRVHHEKFPRR